jgi:hypothetical protein
MSPRKEILRTLARRHEQSPSGSLTRPAEIDGYATDPERYQKAVNQLLQERLVEGRKDERGGMAIALNGHRIAEVRKELRPIWMHPGLWAAAVTILVVAIRFVA